MDRLVPIGSQFLRVLLLAMFGLLLAACGGGDSDDGDDGGGGGGVATTLSGTAAAGAPIIGTVTVKDSSSPPRTRSVAIEADGGYTVDVSGLTPPFMLRADGRVGAREYSLYSAAAQPDVGGTVNITPLTDLIVANVAGQVAANVYASGEFAGFTPAELDAAQARLRERLLPVLGAVGVGGSIDLLRASFAADHTGLDAALDALRVEVDPATVQATITSLIDNQRIIDDLASRTDDSVLPASDDVGPALSELQQIVAAFDAFSALFATSMPASNNAALNAMLTDDFLLDGQDRAAFLSEITSQDLVGLRVEVLGLEPGSLQPAAAPTRAEVHVRIAVPGDHDFQTSLAMQKVGGTWRNAGNGRIAFVEVLSFARLQDVFVGGQLQRDVIDSGLRFDISDEGGRGISYAIVRGKGLPSGGVLYVNYTRDSSFGVAEGPYRGEQTPRLFHNGHDQVPLSDSAIATLSDTEAYTIELWRDNGTVQDTSDDVMLAAYTSALTKRPYMVSELGLGAFAAVTAPTQAALRSFAQNGGTLAVTWTLPTGKASSGVHFFRSGSTGFDSADADVARTATSATLTMAAPTPEFGTLQAAGINLFVTDAFGRELVTIYNAQ